MRWIRPAGLVGSVFLLYPLVAAIVALLQFEFGGIVAIAAFLAVPLAIASGLVTARILGRYDVREPAAYFANAVLSAAFASYVYLYNFSIAENLGDLMQHVPKNGRDASDGMMAVAPPLVRIAVDAYREIPRLVADEWTSFFGTAVIAFPIAALCGGLFWWRLRSARSTNT